MSTREDMWSGYFERVYRGERCIARTSTRTCARQGWRYYNVLSVTFLNDDGTTRRIESIPAGRFNGAQRCTGRRLRYVDNRWQ
jgi:hypothetical protein